MTYAAGQIIDNDDYNGFVVNNAYNVNAWWAAGSGNSGWGQPALGTVDNGDIILASSWAALVNTIQAAANHTGTTITARTVPVSGNTITAMPNIGTDIESINTNRGNAINTGALNSSWSGSAARTSSTGSGNDNWTITWTSTVAFDSADQARYFFNAGGLIRLQMNKSSTGTTKDPYWNSLAGSTGTIYISGGINGSQTIGGVSYTGVSVDGASGSYTYNSSAGWYYLLTNGATQIYQKFQTTSPYGDDSITVTAEISGSTLTLTTVWSSPGLQGQSDNSISGGTNTTSPFSSFGTAPAVVVNAVAPSTSYLANTWGSTAIVEAVSASTSPGPAPAVAEVVVVGGGGGGGSQGGGGGGGYVYRNNLTLPTAGQRYTVIIGAGGQASVGTPTTATYGGYPGSITVYTGAPAAGSQGSTTSIDANGTSYIAYGGGGGGSVNSDPAALIGSAGGLPIFNGSYSYPGVGGSAPSGGAYGAIVNGANGSGYRGGANQGSGGGGGGAGGAGTSGITPNVQVGGNGYDYWQGTGGSIWGFAAGGGAGGYSSLGGNPFPSSGTYGGSYDKPWYGGRAGILAGDRSSGVYNNGYQDAQSALANTGSGGGGAAYGEVIYGQGAGTAGGNGGSGAIVIRYTGSTSLLAYTGQWETNITSGYVYHKLNTSGALYPLSDAPTPVPGPNLAIEYQLIGGGGTGGVRGGGGGAGGVKQASGTLISGTSYTISIGAGASGVYAPAGTAAAAGYSGQNSNFTGSGIAVSAGGGGYGGAEGIYGSAGGPGGSGGGGAMPTGPGGIADPFGYGTLGYAGGVGENQAIGAYTFGEAGGGGASQAGMNGSYGGVGGQGGYGGAGIVCYDNVRRAGGGGGAGRAAVGYGGNNGAAGYGYGASAGALPDANTNNALPNTGAGSGGAYAESVGVTTGNGGSGVCVIRYPGTASKINYTGTYTTQTIGGYVVHTITSSGTLTVAATTSWTTYIVGGGGGGAGSDNGWGGGGGGGLLTTYLFDAVPGTTYSVVVGSGGAGTAAYANGSTGGTSSFASTSSVGGGGGYWGSQTGGTGGTSGSGKPGGSGGNGYGAWSGGGGGDSAAGTSGQSYSVPGTGGAGTTITNIGAFGGGGGGCASGVGGGGAGGTGGGGAGTQYGGTAGTANTGGGGGGSGPSGDSSGGNGGSGVVKVVYASPTALATGGAISTYSSGGITYQVHTFTSSGSLTVLPGIYTVGDGNGYGSGSGLVYGAHTTSGGNAGMPGLSWVQNYDTGANLWQVNCASNNWFPLIITLNNIYRLGSSDMGYTLDNVPIFMWRHPTSNWTDGMITNELGMNANQISRSFRGHQVWWQATYAGMDDQLYWGLAVLDSRNYSAGTPGNTWTLKTVIPYWYASDFGGEWQGHGFITYPSLASNTVTVPQTFTRTGATSRDGGGYAPPTRSDYAVTLDQYSLVIPVLASNNGFSGGAYNGARNPLTAKFGVYYRGS